MSVDHLVRTYGRKQNLEFVVTKGETNPPVAVKKNLMWQLLANTAGTRMFGSVIENTDDALLTLKASRVSCKHREFETRCGYGRSMRVYWSRKLCVLCFHACPVSAIQNKALLPPNLPLQTASLPQDLIETSAETLEFLSGKRFPTPRG